MAEKIEPPKPAPKSAFSLIDPRDHFIGIALGKLLDKAFAEKQFGQYEMTARHAVRYADAIMVIKAEPVQKLSSGVGKKVAAIDFVIADPKIGAIEIVPQPSSMEEPSHPKTIAETIGNVPELEEVK